jgi:glycosyltransferase involved in cell wall biosynthesis
VPHVDKVLRIVHIITRLILGGAQENTLITCRELARRGHDVTLITGPALGPEGELFDQAENAGFKVIVIDKLCRQINPLYDIPAYGAIRQALRGIKPDVVHTHSAKAGILGRLAAYGLKGSYGASHIPAIVHGIHGLSFHRYQNSLLNRFYIAIERATARRTDFFISVADAMTRQSLNAGIGRSQQYATAYSAIDEEGFLRAIPAGEIQAFRRRYNIPDKSIVLVTIARLFHLKGHEFIIESARRLVPMHPDCIWLFVGDGILKDGLTEEIAQRGLADNFRFTGLMPPCQVPLAIQASDLLVHCSLREGLARALPQAMLCGKPVVSFDLDGASEVVNSQTGRLVEPEDVDGLVAACDELIRSRDLRERLGKNGRELVREKFAPATMVDTIETVYKRLLQP